MTPELKAYIVQIIIQRQITEDQFTPEVLGELMKLGLEKMGKAACVFLDRSYVRSAVEKSIYDEITLI